MKTTAIIETGPDGGFDIFLPDIECAVFFGDGDTVLEAKEDLMNSYQELLDLYKEEGKPVPEELRDLEFDFNNASGDLSFVVTCTTNSIYVNSISITSGGGSSVVYSNYSTSCGGGESIVETIGEQEKAVRKEIRNGQLVIIRGEEVYSITGERME